MSLVATVGNSTRNSGKLLYQANSGPNTKRFLVIGLNKNVIADGILLGLFANSTPGASNGTYSLALSNVVGSDGDGNATPVNAVDGALVIQGTAEQAVRLHPAGVLNGASLIAESVSPGQVVTLIGSGIGPEPAQAPDSAPSSPTLGGTSVLFDATPAPLLYAGGDQINAIVPYAVNGRASTQLQITREGRTVASMALQVVAAAPAIFTLNGSGVGPGAILNQDSTVNSGANPADRGSLVVIFATGAGQTVPDGSDGRVTENPIPRPILPVSVQIGGLDAEVLFAGLAPGLVSGVLQVNCRVPANVVAAQAVPVILKVGTATSQQGVTLAVR
jgi:uncharacterized protein (TIGR03437 family)